MQLIPKKIYLTGASGFIGTTLQREFLDYEFLCYSRDQEIKLLDSDIVLHLAGKAHDKKNISCPDEYYEVNTELTKKIFDAFLNSEAKVFITLSSVKAVADQINGELSEEDRPLPVTHYGKSKLLADQYIFSKNIPKDKKVFILRPSMIHGPGNKGNINLLYLMVTKGLPWPLGAFENKRSYCGIDNLCYIIYQLLEREEIPSGIYNLADDEALSTNELIRLIATTTNKKVGIFNAPKKLIKAIARIGDVFRFPLNSEKLDKLTKNFVVSNSKIKAALKIERLPVSAKEGLIKTINSFI